VHKLIGAEVSLYTGKVRAYLRYKGIPFEEVAARAEIYRDVIIPRTGVRYIPVLISDDDVAVQDSTAIIDFLEARYPEAPVYPSGSVQRIVALVLETYADEWLVVPAMHYRWNVPENRAFAIEEFGRLSLPDLPPEQQRALGEQLAGPFAGALPALGITAHTAPAIEASYRAFLADFDRHLEQYPFLLGTRPSLADFGFIGPLYAHLYRDPASGRLMREVAPRVAAWVERMRAPVARSGAFLPDDEIPPTLEPLLARAFAELGPVLASTIAALDAFVPKDGRKELPRRIGQHAFRIGDVEGERSIYPFNVWRWQRVPDAFLQLGSSERARADALLDRVGGRELVNAPLRRRLARRNNQLSFEESTP
jgi:glutathione S-transferase